MKAKKQRVKTKTNDSLDVLSKNAFNCLNNKSWTLCLGAGICNGILPNWMTLTYNIVNEVFDYKWTIDEFKNNIEKVGFSLDGWLQSALNRTIQNGHDVSEFNRIIEKHLYGDFIEKAEKKGIADAVKVMIHEPHQLKQNELLAVVDFFDSEYSDSTLIQLKNVLLDKSPNLVRPESIITFNADPILHSLLIIYGVKQRLDEIGDYNFPVEDYVRVTRPFEIGNKKIPILHLHGAIYPELPESREGKIDSRDNLIFSEISYTKTAGIMNSWAQNVFSYKSTNNKMIFIGLSMSDPNIRRWLSWSAENINSQLETVTGERKSVMSHLWIKPKSGEPELNDFFTSALTHLSTKPGWINDWSDLQAGLLNMMGKKQ